MQQSRHLMFVSLVAALGLTGAAPPPPAVYDVRIHYNLDAFGKERIAQYFAMTGFFKRVGFARADAPEETEPEDVRNLPFNGSMASPKVRLLFAERHVQVLRLMPQGSKLPDDKAALLRVHLELPSGFGTERQMLLTEQVRRVLNEIGFKEGAIYDHRDYTRLVGALPIGQLDTVLNDLRKHPMGATLPGPFGNGPPIRVVEIMPDMPLLATRPIFPLPPPELEKLSPELHQLVAVKEKENDKLRFEVILALTPEAEDRSWLRLFRVTAPDAAVEGRLGPLVTVFGPRGQIVALAARPEVAALRLPRSPRPLFPQGADRPAEPAPLTANGLVQRKLQGNIPFGERVAVVDGDFRGWEALRDAYPRAQFRFLDLTRERNRNLQGDSYPATGPGPGQGTRFARILLRASPDADLTLICVDPDAPYQLETIARAVCGDRTRSIALDQRRDDLLRLRDELDLKQTELGAERRRVFEDFRFEGEAEQNRKNYRKKQADHDCDEAAYRTAVTRYLRLVDDLRELKGVRLVLTGLVWDDGHPVEGASTLSRYFDDRAFKGAHWFQYTGDTRGQAWIGLFHDQDRNEVMEFAPPEAALPRGRWTKEINFLAWKPFKGAQLAELPEKTTLRVTLQWREAHEPDLLRIGEDAYREPLANLRLTLVYQPDPAGAKQPDDDLEIKEETIGTPQRLAKTLNSGVYEQSIVFTVPKAGRYAVRITGKAPNDSRPPGVPSLPAVRRTFELKPRLFVATLAGEGRAVLADYNTDAGSLGTPADAKRVERVGP